MQIQIFTVRESLFFSVINQQSKRQKYRTLEHVRKKTLEKGKQNKLKTSRSKDIKKIRVKISEVEKGSTNPTWLSEKINKTGKPLAD